MSDMAKTTVSTAFLSNLTTKCERLEAENADLRAACEQKQEIIDSFQAVDEMRRAENAELRAKLAEGVVVPRTPSKAMRRAGRKAYMKELGLFMGPVSLRKTVPAIYKAMLQAAEGE